MEMVPGGNTLWWVLVLLLAALGLSLRSRKLRQQTGLPEGDVIHTDTGTWFPNQHLLRSPELRLVGKPDYLVERPDGALIPVELKSGRAPDQPREGHVLQLASYCLLVEENFGIRPDFGILQYKDKAYAIDFTQELEEDLLDLLGEMHQGLQKEEIDRDHNDWRRCARCGLRGHCHQRLA